MNNKGQFGGLTSAITSLFSVGVISGVAASLFGKVKNTFMGVGAATKSIFFK